MLFQLHFPPMEPVSAARVGGSASRSRASRGKGLPARLSGAGIEGLRLGNQQLNLALITTATTSDAVPVIGSAYPASYPYAHILVLPLLIRSARVEAWLGVPGDRTRAPPTTRPTSVGSSELVREVE